MEIDFLPGERMLPVRVVSVRLAATILAVDIGHAQYTDAEHGPYLAARYVHQYEEIEPIGAILKARRDIEAAMCRDIDAKRLHALHERRTLAGECVEDATVLDVGAVFDWAEAHGVTATDSLYEYDREEGKIAEAGLNAIAGAWDGYQHPGEQERMADAVQHLDADMALNLLRENARLRAASPSRGYPSTARLDVRERRTLLCIIGALAGHAKLDLSQPMKAAGAVVAMLPGDLKLSPRTIGEHLKGVREAMDSRKD